MVETNATVPKSQGKNASLFQGIGQTWHCDKKYFIVGAPLFLFLFSTTTSLKDKLNHVNILKVYLSKNWFKLDSANLEVVRGTVLMEVGGRVW